MAEIDVDQFVVDATPPDKRTPKMLAWVKALLSAFRWFADLVQTDYFKGATYPTYDVSTNYSKYERVKSGRAIYESLVDSNTGNAITNTAYWKRILSDTIGLNERAKYNSQKLLLEYALNRRYEGVFRQPPNTSDIYITKNNPDMGSFLLSNLAGQGDIIYPMYATGFIFTTPNIITDADMTINIPAALFTSNEEIRQFVNKYNMKGTSFDIVTY